MESMLAIGVLSASLPLIIDLEDKQMRAADMKLAFPDDPYDLNLPVKETFDFVIIGSGAGGSVLARRLSENRKYKVLLLEAGGEAPAVQKAVATAGYTYKVPNIHYLIAGQPQTNGAGGASKGVFYNSAGKMLGGSTSHNGAKFERGSPFDYDRWAEITGDESWRYKNVLKYFLKLEDYYGPFPLGSQHRRGGPMPVVPVNASFDHSLWLDAGKDLGYPTMDSNGPQRLGFCPGSFTVFPKDRQRADAYSAFVKPVLKRKNLHVRLYSVASKIIFEGKRAVGVVYERHGVPSVVFASKEVIVSAGVFSTAMILIRSGIGPEDQLQAANVTPVAILPVGKNFHDHPKLKFPPIMVKDPSVIKKDLTTVQFSDFNEFIDQGTGYLDSYGILSAFIASTRAKTLDKNPKWADIMFQISGLEMKNGITLIVEITRPLGRGSLTYNSTATKLENQLLPIVDFNIFGDPSDAEVMIDALEFAYKLPDTPTWKKFGANFGPLPNITGCLSAGAIGTRAYWKCFAYNQVYVAQGHLAGTAAMGRAKGDPRAVVDSKLRVLGVENLRVVDGSVMPYVTNANTAAPIMMIAEKTADQIKRDWMKRPPQNSRP